MSKAAEFWATRRTLLFHLALLSLATLLLTVEVPAAEHPPGWSDLSYYLPMPDGVRLAVSVWLPHRQVPAQRVPVILIQTRYGRAGVFNYGENKQYTRMLAAGYAVAVVDVRGTTSSFGTRMVEIGPQEVDDMDTLIRHFRTRSWSNGAVIATGVSYMADTADIASGSAAKLTATLVRESDFDAYLDLFEPGGISNDGMMSVWGGDTLVRDYGRSSNPQEGLDCALRAQDCAKLWPRLQPVDGDAGYRLLRQAIASRKKHWQPDDYRQVEFRDDKGSNGFGEFDSSPANHLDAIRRERVPAQYWGSWMDAGTAEAALARFRSLPQVPMELWLTANTHVNDRLTDPFHPDDSGPSPSLDEQWASMLSFIERVREQRTIDRVIHYYVLGAKVFKSTPGWPPAGSDDHRLRLGPGGTLLEMADASAAVGEDGYAVDFSATTGAATRWSTQLGTPANYADRAREDQKLLTYTSAPFEQDMELVGTPSLTLYVTTSSSDPAFFAYIEDVAPDGKSTYLTEGLFRALQRRGAASDRLPYTQSPPLHSFLRQDAEPVVPGELAQVSFPIFPVAALIQKGHRLRLALAGSDGSMFRRYSRGGVETWRIAHTSAHPSALTVQMRPWNAAE